MINKDNVASFFRALPADDTFLVDAIGNRKYSYREFFGLVNALAQKIRDWKTEQIVMCLENSTLLCALYFACAAQNITVIPVDPKKSEQEIRRICASHPDAVQVGIENDCPRSALLVTVLDKTSPWEGDLAALFAQTNLQKPFLITYTSGSTGKPKGVVHSLHNLILSAMAFRDAIGYKRGDVMYHAMPMTYMAGILNTILLPFVAGCQLVIARRFSVMEAVSFWKYVRRYEINCFWMAPAMLRMILAVDKKGTGRTVLEGREVRFSVGTAPLDGKLREQFQTTYGVRLYQSYGLSETLFLTTQTATLAPENHSVGQLLRGVEMKIATDGEGIFSVPWMFLGYWGENGNLLAPAHWYATGDLVEDCGQGLQIKGRKKELIIKGGINLNPHDIELCLADQAAFDQCVVQGVDDHGEDSIICWYVPNADRQWTRGQINEILRRELGIRYQLDALVPVDEIPKNLNGKVDRLKLAQDWKEQNYDR